MSLLRQPPLELRSASARLETLRRRIREVAAAVVLLSAGGVASAAAGHGQVATSLLFAAAVGVAVAPASAALCRRMLCEAAVSPLYNASLSEEDLARLLRAISAGVGG